MRMGRSGGLLATGRFGPRGRGPISALVTAAAAFLAVLATPGVAMATTYYLSPAGSDSTGSGTLASPWRSIGKANSVVGAGDTVQLRDGGYGAVGFTTTISAAGTSSAKIIWQTYPGDARARLLGKYRVTGPNNRFTRVVIDGPTGDVSGNGCNGNSVLMDIGATGVEVDHSEIKDSLGHAGLFMSNAVATGILVHHNWIHDNGCFSDPTFANNDHGIYWSAGSGRAENNLVEDNYARGIQLYHSSSGPDSVVVANNTVVNNGRAGIQLDGATNSVVANNIVDGNGSSNNTPGIYCLAGSGNSAVSNLLYDNAGGSITNNCSMTLSGNVNADPLFVSSTDFHIASGSPAIGMAYSGYAPATDYDDQSRDASPDAGFDERAAAAPVFRSEAHAAANGSTAVTASKPAGTASGDLMIAAVGYRGTAGVTAPSGWTMVRARSSANNGAHLEMYRRIAGSSEPTSYTFSSPTTQEKIVGITAYTGASATTPLAASSGNTGVSGTDPTCLSVTASAPNSVLLWTAAAFNPAAGILLPSDFTRRWGGFVNGTYGFEMAGADKLLAGAGPSGAQSGGISGTSGAAWACQMVAINPE